MSVEFQRGLGWNRPLLSLQSKCCFVIQLFLVRLGGQYFCQRSRNHGYVYALDND